MNHSIKMLINKIRKKKNFFFFFFLLSPFHFKQHEAKNAKLQI